MPQSGEGHRLPRPRGYRFERTARVERRGDPPHRFRRAGGERLEIEPLAVVKERSDVRAGRCPQPYLDLHDHLAIVEPRPALDMQQRHGTARRRSDLGNCRPSARAARAAREGHPGDRSSDADDRAWSRSPGFGFVGCRRLRAALARGAAGPPRRGRPWRVPGRSTGPGCSGNPPASFASVDRPPGQLW